MGDTMKPAQKDRTNSADPRETSADQCEKDLHHALERLRKSEANLKRAEKIAKLGNWEWNILTDELLWSDEVYRIYGADPHKDKPSYDIVVKTVAPEDRDRFVKSVEDAVKRGAPFEGEYRMIGLDGKERFTHTAGEVVRDNEGRAVSMFGIVRDITARRRVEEKLRESEARLSTILDNVGAAIFIKDAQYRYAYANQKVCEIFGKTPEEILGKGDDAFFSAASVEEIMTSDRPVIERGETVSREETDLTSSDGLPHTYWTVKLPLRDSSEKVCGLCGISTDITERKRVEETLRENEEKFSKVFHQAPLLITLSDIETGRLIDVNERYLAISGFAREEVIGRTVLEIGWISEEQRSRMVRNLSNDGRVTGMELSLRRKDGTTVVCLYSGETITVNGQQRLLSIAQDITARKEAEEKIRQGEEFVRSILDTVDEGFIVIDREYRIVTANKAYCGQAGLPSDEVIGRLCYAISHKASRPCYEEGEDCAVRHVFATGEPRAALHKHIDHEGNVLYVETKGYPVRDASGAVTSVIETINNITEKHLLEEERLKTQKLESIGTLAGGIAHDFNNLLQGVFGFISLARLKCDDREQCLAALEEAEKALQLSVKLTNQLLTFSKGGKPVKYVIDLRPVIENAATFALSGSRSDFRLDIDPNLWHTDADGGQMGQVIQNIVLNADQAMPLGGRVSISARNLAATDAASHPGMERGDHIVITIEDQGSGIPEEYLEKIFDPYFTTKAKGSGLGLATSYSIIRNHGGRMEVRSAVGKGSTFRIYLPAVRTEAVLQEERLQPAMAWKSRVLVMDDEAIIRRVAQEMLGSLGHAVAVAEHGEAAVEQYRRAMKAGKHFDVVILDLTVRGGMGGKETLRKLREIDPGVKAVVSSGYPDDDETADYKTYGFRSYLKKPYNMEHLQDVLNRLMA